jgi:exonuclease SbcC
MILNKIRLDDFISHKRTELNFGFGINVVVGPNGAGKTSILDGISFALFNEYSNRGKKENLINSRAKKCKVGLTFTEGGIGYDVEWSMERKGSAHGSFFRIVDDKRILLARDGERSVFPEIQKVLGIDKNLFLQSVYVRQGEIEQLVTARPGDRKELISRLLGVEDLERAWNGIKDVIQVYRDQQLLLGNELGRKSAVQKQRDESEVKSKELNGLLASKRTELGGLESELQGLQALLDELETEKKDFDRFDKERGIINQRIKNLESKLETENEELRRAVVAQEILGKLQDDVNRLPFLDAYVCGLAEKEKLELKQKALQEKLDGIIETKKTLEENTKGYELYLGKEHLLMQKKSERKKYEGSDTALAKAKKQLEKYEKEEKKRNANFARELEKCSSVLGESISVDNVASVLERIKMQFEDKAKDSDAKVKDINGTISVLDQRIKELDENLSKFSSSVEVKACPTCDTELSAERVSQLVSKYSSQRDAADGKLVALRGDLQEADREREQIYDGKRQIEGIDPERLRSLATELTEMVKEVAGAKSEVENLEKQTEMLKALDKELEQLEREKLGFEEAYKEFNLAKRQLDKLPSEEEIKTEKKPLTAALQGVCVQLKLSMATLGYEPQEPQKELSQLRKKKEEYNQNLPIAERKAEYELSVASTSKELEGSRDDYAETVRAIESLRYDEEEHSKKQEAFKQQDKEAKDLEKQIARIDQAIIGAEDELKKLGEELKTLEAKAVEKKLVDSYITVLNTIRDAYGKDGIQKMIRARAKPLLEKSTRDLFERFNLAYSDIKIDDDYNISVLGPSGEQDIDQISGGERVALAIALRLAIAKVLSGKIETVIMDEPTTHLDEERRKELVNILNSFFKEGGRIIPQMIIITHHREIEDVADVIYSIEKKEGYSTAESR